MKPDGTLPAVKREKRSTVIAWLLIALFLVCFALCIPKTSDDWYFYRPWEHDGLVRYAFDTAADMWAHRDGRALGNFLVGLTSNQNVFRVSYWVSTMLGLLLLLNTLAGNQKNKFPWFACVALLLLFTSPKEWFSGNIAWLPGFVIYILPIVLTLAYLTRIRGLFAAEAVRDTAIGCILCLLLGLIGQLFNEIMSACRVVMACGIVIWYWLQQKRPSLQSLFYLAGTAAGLALMFSSPAYRVILGDSSAQTYQQVAKDIPGVIRMAAENYRYVATYAIGANTVAVSCISITGIAIIACGGERKRPKGISTALIAVLAAAPLYFYFTTRDVDALLPFSAVFSSNMIAILLDASVYGCFVLAVFAVLLFYTEDVYAKSLGCLSLLSVLLCAAPLLFARPLAHRTFAAAFVFLCLLALDMLLYVLRRQPKMLRTAATVIVSLTVAVCVVYLLMFVSNPKIERQKMAFIESRMQYGETTIYTPDFICGQRLWYPESALWAAYYYETKTDIAFEHIPYEMWLELFYEGSGLG